MFAALSFCLLFFSACGQIETQKKATTTSALSTTDQGLILSAADFQTACSSKGGVVSNNTCFSTLRYIDIGSGTSTYEEKLLVNANEGARVIAQGSGPIEVVVNGSTVVGMPGAANLRQSGEVKYRFAPGTYASVKIWVVQCYNQGMGIMACP